MSKVLWDVNSKCRVQSKEKVDTIPGSVDKTILHGSVDKAILHGSVNKAILEAADKTIPDKNKVCCCIPHVQHCKGQSVLYTESYANVL